MSEYPILFNKRSDDLPGIGAKGGRAYARNCRARRQAAQPATPVPVPAIIVESTAQAIVTLDSRFPWLKGAERRSGPRPQNGQRA
jgi:hypothetical protein